MPRLLRQHGWHAASYGKIYHLGGGGADWLDVGKSWDEAETFPATPAGRKGEVRNLTGGKLKWCSVGAMEGTDDDQRPSHQRRQATPPNIIFILSDDQGYGDVQCLNPQRGRIKTPSLDKLASQGCRVHRDDRASGKGNGKPCGHVSADGRQSQTCERSPPGPVGESATKVQSR